MLGNVWEWCQDPAYYYKPAAAGESSADEENKEDIKDKVSRVLRGGSFTSQPSNVRCAVRFFIRPSTRNGIFGLRVARTYH